MVTLEEGSWECFKQVKILSSRSSVHPRRKVLMQIVRIGFHTRIGGARTWTLCLLLPKAVAQCLVGLDLPGARRHEERD